MAMAAAVVQAARNGKVTLLFSVKDTRHNDTMALKAFPETKLKGHKSGR